MQGASAPSPIDVQSLAQKSGYNLPGFDIRPKRARFFVIKSYTEEDVHKSLKYEIWASTDLGNKRLDKAFGESSGGGPIYLLFSVNASGHFCGIAEMTSAVDYKTTSTVWAQDKWKGIFQVKWHFVKDVPNSSLRHIRLSNTPENKPVTSSRDTQEVPYDKGLEMLQIVTSFQSRTTMLQDFAWYEENENQKALKKAGGGTLSAAEVPVVSAPTPPNGRSQKHPQHQNQNQNQGQGQGQGAPTHQVPPHQPIRRFAVKS